MRWRSLFFALFLWMAGWLLICAAGATAQETAWKSADYLQARLVGAQAAQAPDGTYLAGFDLRLADGWHAYWRMPGDGGLPPRFDWGESKNIRDVTVLWPRPERFETMGLYSFGYEGAVLMPLKIKTEAADKPARLAAHVDIMVCRDICVPQTLSLSLPVPAADGPARPGVNGPRIDKAMQDIPAPAPLPDLDIRTVTTGPDAVVVNAYAKQGFAQADLFIEAGDLYLTAVPEITPDKSDPRQAMLRVAAPEGVEDLTEYLAGRPLTLTLTDGRHAVEKTVDFH